VNYLHAGSNFATYRISGFDIIIIVGMCCARQPEVVFVEITYISVATI
jgi:hypothetical protein